MDSNRPPMNRQIDHLGVNKMGKNIKKSPQHQPSFANNPNKQQPKPQVYNINKNDFRNIVQQLTGSPLRDQPPRPPQNHPKPPNHRLQRVRPPPLAPVHPHFPAQPQPSIPPPYPNSFARPHFDQLSSPRMLFPPTPSDVWANTTESPISAYMRYLHNSIVVDSSGQNLAQPHFQHNPNMPPILSPRVNGPSPNLPSPRFNDPPPNLPSPRFNGPPPLLPSPRMNGPHPPPRTNGPSPLLPSPTSQYLLPSPSGFYGLLSPGYQHPPLISPNFSFASVGQSGILGPGPHPPPSPSYVFPLSPGFFSLPSPRWRNQ